MALDPNNTPRAFVTYNVDTANHTMMVRCNADASDGDLSEEIGSVLEAMGGQLTECTFVKLERSAAGSNVRVPATWSGPTTWGSGDQLAEFQNRFWSFTGKDSLGHKTRVDFFGRHLANNTNFRLFAVEDSTIAATIAAMEDAPNTFFTIGDNTPIWNRYANESFAQHWTYQGRK